MLNSLGPTAWGRVKLNYGKETEITRITLPYGYRYLILFSSVINISIANTMLATTHLISGEVKSSDRFECRTAGQNGGGLTGFGWYIPAYNNDIVVGLYGYGYQNIEYYQSGAMYAIRFKLQNNETVFQEGTITFSNYIYTDRGNSYLVKHGKIVILVFQLIAKSAIPRAGIFITTNIHPASNMQFAGFAAEALTVYGWNTGGGVCSLVACPAGQTLIGLLIMKAE